MAAGGMVTLNSLFSRTGGGLAFSFLMPKRQQTWVGGMNLDQVQHSNLLARQTSRTLLTRFSSYGNDYFDERTWILRTSQSGSWENMYDSQPPRPIAITFPIDRLGECDRLGDTVWRCRGMEGLKLREILEDLERHIAEAKLTDREYVAELWGSGVVLSSD